MRLYYCLLLRVLIIVKADIEVNKRLACNRGIKIVAASKTEDKGIFRIFEGYKAWLYNAENQTILEYYDIEDEVRKHSDNSPIIRATRVRTCFTPDGFGLQDQQFITETKNFQYEDIKNVSSWKVTDQKERIKLMAKLFSLSLNDLVTTVGSACDYENRNQTKYIHVFASKDSEPKYLFRFCKSIRCNSKPVAVYSPFSIEKIIKETSTIPDALSLDFDVLKSNPRVLFVIGDIISYWTLDENGEENLREAPVSEVFGCEPVGSKLLVFVYIFGGLVVITVVLGAALLTLVLIRKKTVFEVYETTSVHNAKALANSKTSFSTKDYTHNKTSNK